MASVVVLELVVDWLVDGRPRSDDMVACYEHTVLVCHLTWTHRRGPVAVLLSQRAIAFGHSAWCRASLRSMRSFYLRQGWEDDLEMANLREEVDELRRRNLALEAMRQ
jgi:hypothetical protein